LNGRPVEDNNGEVLPRLLYLTTNADGKLVEVEQVEAEDGTLNLNFNGATIPVNDVLATAREEGLYLVNLTRNDAGELIVVQQAEDGTFTLNGAPVAAGDVLTVIREQRMQLEHIFIHEDAAYFD